MERELRGKAVCSSVLRHFPLKMIDPYIREYFENEDTKDYT